MSVPTPEPPEDSISPTNPGAPGLAFETWVRKVPRGSLHTPDARRPRRTWLKRLLIATGILALLLVIVTIAAAIALRHAMHAALPQLDGSTAIAGLTSPVTITRDDHGVPSIHATNLDDLLFAQGFITASDRLFQMDALRRHGAGELAELLGPSLIEHDREQRILQLRTAADRAIAVLPADQLHQLQVYANGVNAFIASATAQKRSPSAQDLPVEFHILHYTPAPWTPRDTLLISLVMAQELSTEFPTKLNREALAAHLPAALLPDLYPSGSWRDHPPAQTPTDLTAPDNSVQQVPLDNTQSRLSSPHNPTLAANASPQDLLRIFSNLRPHHCDACRAGSNNWAVAGTHTANGAPLLSNDMHLGLTAPDIWYEAALHASGPTPFDVEGFTLPGVPFVIVGRNPFVSWGFTNSGADVQDVLIEHLRGSGSQTEYQHPDGTWSLAGHQLEHIHVRAGHDITLDILTTTHTIGTTTITTPIISPLYKSEHRALALAWTIYDPSNVTSPMYSINTATDAASLVAAFASFATVSQNLVYADAHHIGYHLLGRIPIRGPAIQRPRPTQPFILPDTTPSEDEDDESGDPDASLIAPPASSSQPGATTNSVISTGAQRSGETPVFVLASTPHNSVILSAAQRSRRTPKIPTTPIPSTPSAQQAIPTAPTTAYTIGSPISPIPIDALDPTQTWSGYIPYDALPSVLDPTSGIIATANARIVTDDYPYFIANNWVDPYRVERINHLLENKNNLTPADMLRIQTDVHSEFDLLIAQRLAYALDHSALTKKDPRLHQAADLLRDWNGDVSANSPAAAIVASTHDVLWPMLLTPQILSHDRAHKLKPSPSAQDLYAWEEKSSALEQILQHTPARWLPRSFPTWNDFLTTAVERGLRVVNAPSNLSTWTYGPLHPVDIAHPIFGSHSPISTLLGVPTGSGFHPNGGDYTTIKAADLSFGPSERFTADLANPDNTQANITTGESGNPASPWFLDQFIPWLNGTTFTLPLTHPTITHTLTLTPQ
jgi:penicillin G amidase